MSNNPHRRKHSLSLPLSLPPSSGPLRQKIKQGVLLSEGLHETPGTQWDPQHLAALQYIKPVSTKKRKQNADDNLSVQPQVLYERRDTQSLGEGQQQRLSQRSEGSEEQDSIQFWAETGNWPKSFGEMKKSESNRSKKRRRHNTPSSSSSCKDESAPRASTVAFEDHLLSYGVMFDNDSTTDDLLNIESKEMYQKLRCPEDFAPSYNSCSEETYIRLFQRASGCNEERVRRDLTPFIVPSAELLCLLNGETALGNVREEIAVDWTKCSLFGGSRPRPDYAYGLSSAAFTDEELIKMNNYTTFEAPTKFTESMYFPFLLCEAKCGKRDIVTAGRENMHSASIAVNAIVKLCRAAGEDTAQSMNGKILVFSVSHDIATVKIYGHYPLIAKGLTTFHRYKILEYRLGASFSKERNIGSNFVRTLYRDFYIQHLQRIQNAIAGLPDPQLTHRSDAGIRNDDIQVTEHSWQEMESSPGPLIRGTENQGSQEELTLVKQQLVKIEQMYGAQLEQQEKQMDLLKEEKDKQFALLERLLNRDSNK